MDKEQILALAEEQGAVANLKQHFNVAGDSIVFTPEELEAFFNAVIESYKAELLKEAGEPVAEVNSLRGNTFTSHLLKLQDGKHMLYTSDQVAAAVAKATKPLEDEVKAANSECELFRKNGRIVDANKIVELSTPLAAAQEEIERPPAIDAYETYMADDKESDPVERLRFFLSLALKGKDWLDVEKFIDDVSDQLAAAQEEIERLKATPPDKREDLRCVISDLCHQVRERDAQLAKAEQRVAEACALTYLEDYDLTDIAERVRAGEWRKFVKEM